MAGYGASPRRLVYLGTPELAVPPLRALVDAGYDIGLVVSRVDKRRGRGGATSPSPVKVAAIELGLPYTEKIDEVLDVGADLGVVVAYGRIIKPHIIDAVPLVNIHFSLLPRWRGAAPLERAILAGDTETGVCLMEIAEELDAGGVFACERVPIGPDDTAAELRDRLVDVGTALLLDRLERGLGDPEPQSGETVYAQKLTAEDLHLDWSKPAVDLHRVVRVGGAWTTFRGHRLKVHDACPAGNADGLAPGELDGLTVGTGDGALELVEVQPEGKGRVPATAWRNGAHPQAGESLGE
jgi:methionyl-tRNA formyltransferase